MRTPLRRPLSMRDLPVLLVLLALATLLLALGSTYVGHASSPYDTCYAASGRAVPCALLESRRR